MWLLTSAMIGFEKNRLSAAERALRVAAGFAALVPSTIIAAPAVIAGLGLIIAHRFLGGEPSPVDVNSQTNVDI